MKPGLGFHLQQIQGKPGEGAEALGASGVADPDRQRPDPGGPQRRQGRSQSLGVFQAVEVAQLGEEHHQAALTGLHPRDIGQVVQQGRWGLHGGR